MECDICRRNHDAQLRPFLCVVDARNHIYDGRMKNLQLLIENEGLQGQIHDLLADKSKPTKDAGDNALAQQRTAEAMTDQVLAAADKLRGDIKAARDEIQSRKAALARRRSDLASVSAGLVDRRTRQQKDLEKSIQMLRFRWAQSAEDMARTRAFLCAEAVKLYGLKRVSKKGGGGRYEYQLGKLPIVDLISMDSLSPEVISTSLGHIAHILVLISHYLAIRLPAELTLPHRDYPRPTVFNLSSSYHHGDVSFPGTPVSTTVLNAPRAADARHVPRPRPLFIDRPLSQLLKEDPVSYSLFIEAVTLLSYDIAWLCCSQGVSIGDKGSFEDICNMGRNLHSLLMNNSLQGTNNLTVTAPSANSNADGKRNDAQQNWIGRYSHGTAFYFMVGADGTEFVKTFKLPSPMKLADKLKRKLLGDAPAADWEVLDDDAWKDDGTGNETPNAYMDKGWALDGKASPRPSTNGWMKVKSR